jgi:hypothetical protein
MEDGLEGRLSGWQMKTDTKITCYELYNLDRQPKCNLIHQSITQFDQGTNQND